MKWIAPLLVLVLALTVPAVANEKPGKRFLLKDGSTVEGIVIDEGETHYLVKTVDGGTIRVPYAEIDNVERLDGTRQPEASPGESSPGVDVFALRGELHTLLEAQVPAAPREVTVLPYGLRIEWRGSRTGAIFCPGGRHFVQGPDDEGTLDDRWRCHGEWLPMTKATIHWAEIGTVSLVAGSLRGEAEKGGTHHCVALNSKRCLAITGEADATRIKTIIEMFVATSTTQ